ncbi:hypothetical protein [Chromobacterium violaceum]|uniref:hypothetical protein n=1 Tax=Chromobacterium violaceum TaxID=536 RepID=UPI001CE13A9B|nr:hypothetical protein [Chromobacterium violaceum]
MSKPIAPPLYCLDAIHHACDFAQQLDAVLTCLAAQDLPRRAAATVAAGRTLVEHYSALFEDFRREAEQHSPPGAL